MTGPVALELRFVSTRPTPAAIHRMAKWALDVLEQPSPTAMLSADRRPLVYRNDRQVRSGICGWSIDGQIASVFVVPGLGQEPSCHRDADGGSGLGKAPKNVHNMGHALSPPPGALS
ncbi:hypothetical protein [Micromonospora haikouensis]|uniref:hypothetical protein n=1 Tax=Micromonospora haikouensis TaxID=686309 RepID=UPI0037957897